ncbi:MAG: c-type cytochrome [Gemmatimonadota bacterium]|nr:c-type cytochrome [Gemmatimonadota bacterium]
MRDNQRTHCARVGLALLVISSLSCERAPSTGAYFVFKQRSPSVAADSVRYPAGPAGDGARHGFAILAATHDSLPAYVGANLRCFSCHLDNGTRRNAIPLTGAYARYPNFSPRENRVVTIQDRVNSCFRRSMAGRAIPFDGEQMNAIVMYLAAASRGVSVGSHVKGEGLPDLSSPTADTSRGSALYSSRCARCHGTDGDGIPPATPLWGRRSYSIAASLARRDRAASFIRHNMPLDSAGVLSDQDAFDVASYVLSHARPDSPDKELDWSGGGAPGDVPYNTRGHVAFNPPRLLPPSR